MKLKNVIKLYVVSLMMTTLGLSQTHIPGGNISGVWTLAGSPYYIEGNCVIQSGSTLNIEPGVQVIFSPSCRFRVEGQLLAIGTENDSITFTALDTTIGSESIDFLNTDLSPQDSSKLVYCKILYGVGSPWPDPYMHGGGLYLKNASRVLISHCLITHCRTQNIVGADGGTVGWNGEPGESVESGKGGAIYCDNSSPVISYNLICGNHTGDAQGGNGGEGEWASSYYGPANGGDGGDGGTAYAGDGGAIFLANSAATILGNEIMQNYAGLGQGGNGGDGGDATSYWGLAAGGDGGESGDGFGGRGGAIHTDSSHAVLGINLICQNRCGDGYGGDGGDGGDAEGAMMALPGYGAWGGDGAGGSGYAFCAAANSNDSLMYCTISEQLFTSSGYGGTGGHNGNSSTPNPSGQGISGEKVIFGDQTSITNCVVWNNADPTISINANVTYSCVEDGHTGIGNISTNPLFVLGPAGSHYLSQFAAGQFQQSPCVDAGDPYATMIIGTTRTDGIQDAGVVDMGYHYPLNIVQPAVILTVTPYNPPIQIPASGGSFDYNIAIENNSDSTIVCDVWCNVTLPDSSIYGPVLGPVSLSLPSTFSGNRDRMQFVPYFAPAGVYSFNTYIGIYPDSIIAQDNFGFEKLDTGEGAYIYRWNNSESKR